MAEVITIEDQEEHQLDIEAKSLLSAIDFEHNRAGATRAYFSENNIPRMRQFEIMQRSIDILMRRNQTRA